MNELMPWRLNLLRAPYLPVAVGTAYNFGPSLWSHGAMTARSWLKPWAIVQ